MRSISSATGLTAVMLVAVFASAQACADAAAGAALFKASCSKCHAAADWRGDDLGAVTDTLRKLAAGSINHRVPVQLDEQQIADLAAYLVAGAR